MSDLEVIRPEHAAEQIGRHVETLKRWDKEGLLPAKRDSQGWAYYTRELIEMGKRIASQRRSPVADRSAA